MKFTKIAAGVAMAMVASVASADYLSFGLDEYEVYTDEAGTDTYHNTVSFGFNPIEGSPLAFYGLMSYLGMESSGSNGAASGERVRHQILAGYTFKSGDLTFNPKAGLRRHDYSNGGRDHEWRVYTDINYKLNDSTDLYMLPLFIFKDYRNSDAVKQDHFNYEIEAGVNYKLNPATTLNAALFTEQKNGKDAIYDAAASKNEAEKVSDWELRGALRHTFSDTWSGETFFRYTFKNDTEYADGSEADTAQNYRVGVGANYTFNEDWSINGKLWYDKEYKDSAVDHENAKLVYILMAKRSF